MTRKLTLPQLLDAISIDCAGLGTFELFVSEGFDTIDKILELPPSRIALIGKSVRKTIGMSNASAIYESLRSPRIQAILPNLGLYLKEAEKVDVGDHLAFVKGQNVCMTGTAPIDRKKLSEMLKAAGANVQSDVSSTTQILFIEDPNSTSGKAKKARSFGTKVLSYDTLFPQV